MTGEQYEEQRTPDSAIMKVQDSRVIILLTQTFTNLQKSMEESYGCDVKAAFYEAGHFAGTRSAKVLLKEWEERGIAFLDRWSKFYSSDGVGWFKVVSYSTNDDGHVSGITIDQSFIVDGYGKSDNSVCHFLCGFFAGGFEHIFNRHVTCEETECASAGHKHCQFIFNDVE